MNRNIFLILLAALAFVSCKTSKKVDTIAPTPEPIEIQTPDSVTVLNPEDGNADNYTARIHVSIDFRGNTISTKGHLRMRRNEVIQISILDPFLNISEVGRLEISRDNVLLINRVNNEYMLSTYDELNSLVRITPELSFELIQEHFWREAQRTDTDSFSFSLSGVNIDLKVSDRGSSSKWEPHTQPSSRYQQVSPQQLFTSLIQ